jgi:hypothetical protein
VEHRCYQCDAAVEDGVAFCSQCKAPQIRVVTAEAPASPENPSLPAAEKSQYPPLRPQSSMAWAQALPAAFLGLLITTLLSSVLRGALGVGLLASGFLSVYFFRRRNPFARLTLGLGARLGALTGMLGFAITAIATAGAIAVLHSAGNIHSLMLKAIQQYGAGSTNPQMAEVLEFYASRQGFVVMLALGFIMMLILFLVVSGVGGMLGAAALKRKDSI